MPSCFVFAAGNEPLIRIGSLDIVIIAIYFVVVLGIGFYLKRYASTGEDFFMAGRKMTAWIAGLSFISANLSSLETMGWSAMAYQYGMLGAHAYLIGAIPAILFLAIVMMPFYYICRTHSVPGYLKLRYGDGRPRAGRHLVRPADGAGQRGQHVRHGEDPAPAAGLEHEREHLGGLADGGHLRDPGRADLGGVQRGLQFFLIWFGSLLDSDPRPDRRRRLERHDGQDPGTTCR